MILTWPRDRYWYKTFSYSIDVQASSVWEMYKKLRDPRLSELADQLRDTVMKSRADSTTKKYLYAFERWRQWASDKEEISVFPVQCHQLALYLQHVGANSCSCAAVEEAVNAISWAHHIAGIEGVSDKPIVRATVAGLKRKLAKPKKKKEPITREILLQLAKSMEEPPSLTDSRLLAICLLAFSGFLRFNEVVALRCCDIQFKEDHMVVKVLSSKTDQYREGADIVIGRSGSSICPVARVQQYFKIAELDQSSTQKLFRAISKSSKGEKLRKGGSLSYTRVRELVSEKLQELGHDPSLFGTHSFRAGGATLAANNGVEDRLFKRHGRWKSESAKDGYVKDSLEARLRVSKSLNL